MTENPKPKHIEGKDGAETEEEFIPQMYEHRFLYQSDPLTRTLDVEDSARQSHRYESDSVHLKKAPYGDTTTGSTRQ